MGELFAAGPARLAGAGLTEMFNATNIRATRDRVNGLRTYFPGLLRSRDTAPPNTPTRQMTLRFAAWLLTSDIVYSPDDPSRGNFRDWLKWLTYLKKHHPKTHNRIRNRIEANLDRLNPKPMVFTWSLIEIEGASVEITEPATGADFITIEVLAKDAVLAPPSGDEDNSNDPPDEPPSA